MPSNAKVAVFSVGFGNTLSFVTCLSLRPTELSTETVDWSTSFVASSWIQDTTPRLLKSSTECCVLWSIGLFASGGSV